MRHINVREAEFCKKGHKILFGSKNIQELREMRHQKAIEKSLEGYKDSPVQLR